MIGATVEGAMGGAMEERGLNPAAVLLALVVHGLLLVLLVVGVSWKSQPPPVVEAQLWSELPGPAATPKRAPPPQTPRPKVKKAEPLPEPEPAPAREINRKAEPEKKPKAETPPEPKAPVPEKSKPEKKPATDPTADFQRQLQEEQGQRNAANAQFARRLGEYQSRVAALVRQRIVFDDTNAPNYETEIEVTQLPTLEVVDTRVIKSSGNLAYDQAVQRALERFKFPPLPEGVPFERVAHFKFRLRDTGG